MDDVFMDKQAIFNIVDHTQLKAFADYSDIQKLCEEAIENKMASVCIPPSYVKRVHDTYGDELKVCTVIGFPNGNMTTKTKVFGAADAVVDGADEIDMVISRGKFLEGNLQEVYDEIRAIREVCKNVRLKVILETGELKTPQNIYKASQLAIAAGADFIKTSTGKIAVNATPEAFLVMMDAIKLHYLKTGKKVGIKAAGGISDPDTAMVYLNLLSQVLGKDWLTNSYFRIGASRLATKVFDKIQ